MLRFFDARDVCLVHNNPTCSVPAYTRAYYFKNEYPSPPPPPSRQALAGLQATTTLDSTHPLLTAARVCVDTLDEKSTSSGIAEPYAL